MGKKKDLEYNFTFNGTTYVVGLGGIHSLDLPRIIRPTKDEILIDADIGGQYPWTIIKRKLYPEHLGPEWLIGYEGNYNKRNTAKKEGKKSITEALKLANNGGGYGKLGEEYNWQYSPESMYKCTIGNQVEILMLIEKLETNGIHCISANTDGILCLFSNKLMDKYKRICTEWETQVGNSVMGSLEYTPYSFMVQTSVNDYLAVKLDGISKCKGDFVTDFELHKNKSGRIIPLALNEYFIKGTSPDVFIKAWDNIYDFCFGVKAKGEGKLVLFDNKTSSTQELQKINRYFVSTSGHQMYKQLPKLEEKKITRQLDIFGNISDGTRNISIQAGFMSTVLNNVSAPLAKDYSINYDFYIQKVRNIINSIENKEDDKE